MMQNRVCRRIPLSDTPNFRDLGGYATLDGGVTCFGVFYRSACPNSLSDDDKRLLKDINVTTAVDLRGGGNVDERQQGFTDIEGIDAYNIPIGGGQVPRYAADCPDSYIEIADSPNVKQVFQTLAQSNGAAVFHCFAGKDRTGVVAAILLMLAGVADVDIVADYTLTYAYFLKRLRQDFLRTDAEPDVFKPLPEHMEGFLRLFRQKYGDARNYLLQLGLTANQIDGIVNKFVTNC